MKRLLLAGWVVMALFACFAGKTHAVDSTITLDDNAGLSSFVVQDSDEVDQFKVNSDGQGYFAGNVGIGTTGPDQELHVAGDVSLGRRDQSTVQRFFGLTRQSDGEFSSEDSEGTTGMIIDQAANGNTDIHFKTGIWGSQESKKVVIKGNGNVGIGTTNPRNPLGIRGSGLTGELISFENPDGVRKWHINQNLQGLTHGLNFAETGVFDGRLFLQEGGNVGIGTRFPKTLLDVNPTSTNSS